ncbi:MAG: hypothetical protein ACUZ8E_11925 [Candidatus Anammoxibacter sp.]
MEDIVIKPSDGNEEGITVGDVNVQMFDLDEGLNKIMTHDLVNKAGALAMLLLAVIFGVMFIIGTIGLVSGKNKSKVTAETTAVEANEEGTIATSENNVEE